MISWRITSSDKPRIPPPSAPKGIISSTTVIKSASALPSDSRFTGVLSAEGVGFDIVKVKVSSGWGTTGWVGRWMREWETWYEAEPVNMHMRLIHGTASTAPTFLLSEMSILSRKQKDQKRFI